MRINLDYDRTYQIVEAPDRNLLGIIGGRALKEVSADGPAWPMPAEALAAPVGSPRLHSLVSSGDKVAIVASPALKAPVLPALIEIILSELSAKEVPDASVTVVVGRESGVQAPNALVAKKVGRRIYERVRCLWSDPDDFLRLGRTLSGTPVDVTASVVEADKVIALGAVGYDQFAGYSGGAQTLIPLAAGKETADQSLRLTLRPGAEPGRIIGNPVREDLEAAAAMLPIDFILDVVLDDAGRVVMAAAGHPLVAHRACCAFLDEQMSVEVDTPASIVLASCGGAPFDKSLAKAMETLCRLRSLAAPEGIIVLAAACPEGAGDEVMGEWLAWADHPMRIIERAEGSLKPGGHLAAAFARILREVRIFVVAEPALRNLQWPLLKAFATLDEALRAAMARVGNSASIWVLPKGRSVLPRLREQTELDLF
ncbi:MAG: lactate racemase domain-containing protein [Deltaproteobacteria bacterium]|jgi:nickel-dependent lactate racemase|nr:lactate racemase domain-containing protein [Deltaproteobacteria bacterium]